MSDWRPPIPPDRRLPRARAELSRSLLSASARMEPGAQEGPQDLGAGCCPASGRGRWTTPSPLATVQVVRVGRPFWAPEGLDSGAVGSGKDGQGTACGHGAMGQRGGRGGGWGRRVGNVRLRRGRPKEAGVGPGPWRQGRSYSLEQHGQAAWVAGYILPRRACLTSPPVPLRFLGCLRTQAKATGQQSHQRG